MALIVVKCFFGWDRVAPDDTMHVVNVLHQKSDNKFQV